METPETEPDVRLDHAVRLFEFLARVQQVKSPSPRTLDTYRRDGDVIWFHHLPVHNAVVTAHRSSALEPEAPMLVLDRVGRLVPPTAPEVLQPWIDGELDDPTTPPQLRTMLPLPTIPREEMGRADEFDHEQAEGAVLDHLDDHPEITQAFDLWLPRWEAWANQELAARPVRDVYRRLFSVHVAADGNPEELELVCATACLSWHPEGQTPIQRHLLTSQATIDFEDATGRLIVRPSAAPDALSLELDMVDPGTIRDPQRINGIRVDAESQQDHPLDSDAAGTLGRRLVHCLDSHGEYLDQDEPAAPVDVAQVAYAPALILRKRSQQGLIQVLQSIAAQLRSSGEVPEGILPLVDPNHVPDPGTSGDGERGALVAVDDEVFLPLPVNEAQLKIIRHVDQSAQTLVQGPPGTGKTHTAAALIAHLVAQGKRVLVTAQTDRALKEVREKLPPSIRPLSVAVVGAAREDMSQLKVAVERIAATAVEHDDNRTEQTVAEHLAAIDVLRRDRARLNREIVAAREAEIRQYEVHGYSGTLAAIAQAHQAVEQQFAWLGDLMTVGPDAPCPLSDLEIAEWRSYLLDEDLYGNEIEAGQELLDSSLLLDPVAFADAVMQETATREADAEFIQFHPHECFERFAVMNPGNGMSSRRGTSHFAKRMPH